MNGKLRTLLGKITQLAQARGWTAPDPRLVERLTRLEQRVSTVEGAVLGSPPGTVPPSPSTGETPVPTAGKESSNG